MDTRLPIVGVMGSARESHPDLAIPLGTWLATLPVHLLTGAVAIAGRIAMMAARTGIHRGDQLKARGKLEMRGGACDGNDGDADGCNDRNHVLHELEIATADANGHGKIGRADRELPRHARISFTTCP